LCILKERGSGLPTPERVFNWSVCHMWVNHGMASVAWTFTVNSLASADLVGRVSEPRKHLQLLLRYRCCPLMIPPACSPGKWLLSWDLVQYLWGVIWRAPGVVCPKTGTSGFLGSLPWTAGTVSPKVTSIANLKAYLPNAEPGDTPGTLSEEILLGE